MKFRRLVLPLVVAVTMAGCAGTQQTAEPEDEPAPPPPEQTEEAPAPESDEANDAEESPSDSDATPESEPEAAPQEPTDDWFRLDREADRFPGVSVERAYESFLQDKRPEDTVVVAVIDNGIDTDHEDLDDVLWTNRDEVPGNNEDDDDNGYADDVHGWNFIGGPNKNVNHDTYELTRIYARLKPKYEDVSDPSSLSPEEREEYEYYQHIKNDFQKERRKVNQQISQISKARQAYDRASQTLRTYLGVDTLMQEHVESFRADTAGRRVQRAKSLLTRFYRYGVTPSDFEDQRETLQDRLEYGYNPDFNPRPRVGDDYSDTSERYYGNNEISASAPYHGTHVAGIIGAERDNDLGTKGIAGAVRIMAHRAVPDGDERDKDVANAIRYAAENGADIISMSFGKGYSPQKAVVDEAVQYADRKGVLMVHAAGNEGVDVDTTDNFPSKYYANSTNAAETWISVGGSSWQEDNLAAPFSNYGNERVDLFAPGVQIYSTALNDRYDRSSGTSMAAPVVSGVAALVMSYYPELSAAQVKDVLLTTATSYADAQVTRPGSGGRGPQSSGTEVAFGDLSGTGGVVNAYAALQRAQAMARE
jgi:subtilisin family serine protease